MKEKKINVIIIDKEGNETKQEIILDNLSEPINIPKPKTKEKEIKPIVKKIIPSPSPLPDKKKEIDFSKYRVKKDNIPKDVAKFSKGFQLPFFN